MTHTLGDYDWLLVAASFGVALLGALVGLFTSQYARDWQGNVRALWVALTAVILSGCMMWATHFTGLLAYDPGVGMTFDVAMTWLSFVMPTIFAGVAVLVVTRHPESVVVMLVGAATMTMGIVALHYGGIAALRVPAEIVHQPTWVVVSVIIAFVLSTAALVTITTLTGWLRFLSAPVMALAVCAMHYTGMAAMEPGATQQGVEFFDGAITASMLANWVAGAAVGVMLIGGVLGAAGYLLDEGSQSQASSPS